MENIGPTVERGISYQPRLNIGAEMMPDGHEVLIDRGKRSDKLGWNSVDRTIPECGWIRSSGGLLFQVVESLSTARRIALNFFSGWNEWRCIFQDPSRAPSFDCSLFSSSLVVDFHDFRVGDRRKAPYKARTDSQTDIRRSQELLWTSIATWQFSRLFFVHVEILVPFVLAPGVSMGEPDWG